MLKLGILLPFDSTYKELKLFDYKFGVYKF